MLLSELAAIEISDELYGRMGALCNEMLTKGLIGGDELIQVSSIFFYGCMGALCNEMLTKGLICGDDLTQVSSMVVWEPCAMKC